MKSSIYISFEKIEVIGYTKSRGRIILKDYKSRPLQEGTVVNGKIIDPVSLTENLKILKDNNPKLFKSPSLVVDGSSIFSKRLTFPRLTERQYRHLVTEDFTDTAENFDGMICDYHILKSSDRTTVSLLACAVEKVQIEDYINAFKNAGIKLNAIRIGAESIINYVDSKPNLSGKTFVLNIIDGVSMLSIIFENGINVFMARTRLYVDDYEHYIHTILENLSRLIQFTKSEKFNDISCSYYLGLSNADLSFMSEVAQYPNITLEPLNIFAGAYGVSKIDINSHFAFLNILLDRESINLIRSYKMESKLKRRERPKKLWIPAFAIILAVLSAFAVYPAIKLNEINTKITVLNEYLTSAEIVEKSAQLDLVTAKTTHYTGIVKQLESKINTESAKAMVSNEVLDLITLTYSELATITKFTFNESTEIISINGSCATESDSSKYIDALRKNKLIKSINYTGYNSGGGQYNFSIDVKLSAPEVAEDETRAE